MKLTKLKDIKFSADTPVETYKIAVNEWHNVPRCTIQRNEALRVLKAHLRILKLSHWSVFMVVFPDNTKMKIDGHTRAQGWKDGSLVKPPYLSVTVYSVDSLDDAEETYSHYDSAASVKTSPHSIQSAINKHGIVPKSSFVAGGGFGNGMNIAIKFLGLKIKKGDKMAAVEEFKEQIGWLDDLDVKKTMFTSGVAGAYFASTHRFGKDVLPFWQKYMMKNFLHKDGKRDAVSWAENIVERFRNTDRMAGNANNEELAGFILSCVNRFRGGNELQKNHPMTITSSEFTEAKAGARKRPANDNLQIAA